MSAFPLGVFFSKTIFQDFPECAIFIELFEKAERGIQFLNPPENLINQLIRFDEYPDVKKVSMLIGFADQILNIPSPTPLMRAKLQPN